MSLSDIYSDAYLDTYGAAPVPVFPQVPLDLRAHLLLTGQVSGAPAWTDISGYVYQRDNPAVTITRGRTSQSAQATPSTATCKINNRDGRFTASNPAGPWYGLIGRNTPLRFSVPAQGTYLRLEGDTVSSASTPSSASLNITGSIDIRIDLTPTGYASPAILAAKQSAWAVLLQGDGTVLLDWTDSGNTGRQAQSTAPVPLGRMMLRVTLNTSTGNVRFYTAPSMGGAQTQLGATIPGAATSILSTMSAVTVGQQAVPNTGTPGITGAVWEFRLYQGIAGTLVADPVFAGQPEGAASFADAQGNTWTMGGTSEISGRSYRYHGEMSSSPKATDPSLTDVYVPLASGGLLRRLQQGNAPLQSPLERAILAQGGTLTPVAYWPGEDLQGATSLGSAVGGPPMTVLGPAQLASDSSFACSLPVPVMNGGQFQGRIPAYSGQGSVIVRFLMDMTTSPADGARIMRVITSGTCTEFSLYNGVYGGAGGYLGLAGYNDTGTVFDTGIYNMGPVLGTQLWVSIELSPHGAGTTQYTMVVLPAGASTGTAISGTFAGTAGNALLIYPGPGGALGQVGLGHFSIQSDYVSLFDVYQPLNAWTGETAGNRFSRLCTENGLGARVYGHPAVSAAMGAQPVDTLVNLLQQCEDADRGMIYEPRQSYALGYRTLASLLNQAPGVQLDWSQAHLAAAKFVPPVDDDQYTINDVTLTRSSTTASSAASGGSFRTTLSDGSAMSVSAPPAGAGDYATSATVNVETDGQLPDVAGWMVHAGSAPGARYPAIPADMTRSQVAALFWQLQELNIGDYAGIVNVPSWLTPDDVRQLAAGVTEELGGFIYRLTWNGIGESPFETGIFDDPVYGRADTDGSALASAVSATATALSVATPDAADPLWTTAAADFPFDINAGGERMTVTAVTGGASPQSFTVTRSVNGVVKSHVAGEDVRLFFAPVYAIA